MKTTPRLHLEDALPQPQREIELPREQAHYLTGVLRLASRRSGPRVQRP